MHHAGCSSYSSYSILTIARSARKCRYPAVGIGHIQRQRSSMQLKILQQVQRIRRQCTARNLFTFASVPNPHTVVFPHSIGMHHAGCSLF